MDLISREAALSFAASIAPHTNKEVQRIIAQCFDVYADWIRGLPSQGGQKWILVEEKLPAWEVPVLVTSMSSTGGRTVQKATYDGEVWHGAGRIGEVKAWMPLPDPYEE